MDEQFWSRNALLAGTVLVLAIERVVELVVSHRNLARLRAAGTPHEASSSSTEYAMMVAVHVLFLVGPLMEVYARPPEALLEPHPAAAVAAIVVAQVLRWWTIRTLGPRWNARAVVAPSLGAVHDGPYRFLRHPNYLAVTLEFGALPLVAGTLLSGLLIFLLNAVLLSRRKHQEERLLARIPGYREGFER